MQATSAKMVRLTGPHQRHHLATTCSLTSVNSASIRSAPMSEDSAYLLWTLSLRGTSMHRDESKLESRSRVMCAPGFGSSRLANHVKYTKCNHAAVDVHLSLSQRPFKDT